MKSINLSGNNLFTYGFLLVLLSIFDTIFTDFGIRHGHIEEANPLMKYVYAKSVYVFYLLKISLPLLLLFLIHSMKPKLYLRLLLKSAVLLYFIVLCRHAYWLFSIYKEYRMPI